MSDIKITFQSDAIEDISIPEGSFFFHTFDNAIADGEKSASVSIHELDRIAAFYTLYTDNPSEQGLYRKLVDALNASPDTDELIVSYKEEKI